MRIAIVEDEAIYAEKLRDYLHRYTQDYGQEWDVSFFADGISFLNSFKGQFDVILLDISMPVLNGMEVAKRLRAIDSEVVLLFVTNLAQYAIRGYEVGEIGRAHV